MIYYFSSTGNCKYVAQRIADRTGDEVRSLAEAHRSGEFDIRLADGEALGFVLPMYFGELPKLASDFLGKARIAPASGNFLYVVDTYGFHYGNLPKEAAKLLKRAWRAQDATYLVQMVDNWVPQFDLTDLGYVEGAEAAAEALIEEVVSKVVARAPETVKPEWPAPMMLMMRRAHDDAVKTGKFAATGACIGCGMCERACPVGAIEVRGGRPAWVKPECTLCLGCLHRCPKNAIVYDNATAGHGQYFNGHVEPDSYR